MTFHAVTAVVETAPGRFKAEVDPAWTIGGKPNGGYLLALLGRAVIAIAPQPHVIAASAHYLAPPEPGAVELVVEVLRAGRSASQLRARLMQGGVPCVEALLTTSTLGDSAPTWADGVPQPAIAAFEDCVRLPAISPSGARVAIMDEVDVRLDPAVLGFARQAPSGSGELRGWLALPEEDFDALALLYAVDAYPPATFEIAPSGWVPTLELTAYVRALPAPGPVRVLQQARLIEAGRVDEVCFVWDSAGRLVAQATQLAGIRF
jgi:acyl-coenzyme A thioesterase PaaI-like protein